MARRWHNQGVKFGRVHGLRIGLAHLYFMDFEFAHDWIVRRVGCLQRSDQARFVQWMKFLRCNDLRHGLRKARTGRREIAFERCAHLAVRVRPRREPIEIVNQQRVDNISANAPQIVDGLVHQRHHIGIGRFGRKCLAQDAEAFALRTARFQAGAIA